MPGCWDLMALQKHLSPMSGENNMRRRQQPFSSAAAPACMLSSRSLANAGQAWHPSPGSNSRPSAQLQFMPGCWIFRNSATQPNPLKGLGKNAFQVAARRADGQSLSSAAAPVWQQGAWDPAPAPAALLRGVRCQSVWETGNQGGGRAGGKGISLLQRLHP